MYTVNSSNRAKRLEQGWKWRVRQWAREAYAPCAWFSRRRLAPARGNWSWKKKRQVWRRFGSQKPVYSRMGQGRGWLVWVTPMGNSQNTDTVSDYWTGEGRVIQEAKCFFFCRILPVYVFISHNGIRCFIGKTPKADSQRWVRYKEFNPPRRITIFYML